jgi:cell shape-determining protein MreD
MAMNQANRDYKPFLNIFVPCLLLLLVCFSYVLGEIFDGFMFKIWLLPIGVFYWGLFVPNAMPMVFVLLLGLLEDGLLGTPFGLHGFAILLIHYIALAQRQSLIYSPFAMVMTGFSINLGVIMAAMSGVMWLLDLPINLWVFVSWLITIIMFFIFSIWFEFMRRKFMKD